MTHTELTALIIITLLVAWVIALEVRLHRLQEQVKANFDYTWDNARNAGSHSLNLEKRMDKHFQRLNSIESYNADAASLLAKLAQQVLTIAERMPK